MSDRDVIAALQRQAAEAEVERLRLVGELKVERSKRAELVAAFESFADGVRMLDVMFEDDEEEEHAETMLFVARAAIAKATT